VRFALASRDARDGLLPGTVAEFAVAQFGSLLEAAGHYLRGRGVAPTRAVLGAAGPVVAGEVRITNNPWKISAAEVRAALSLDSLRLVNDFALMGAAVPRLPADALRSLGPPATPVDDFSAARVVAIMGPGTGLGVGVLVVRDGRALILETEGGHVSFAPTSDEQAAVQRVLAGRFGRVSNERLVSGGGLLHLYQALCMLHASPAIAASPQAVSAAAAIGTDRVAVHAVELLVEILGGIAGDLVLTVGAWDGLYLAGGLVRPLLHWLAQGTFRQHFVNKGRFAAALERVPTYAVLHPHAGLVGASALALDERIDTVRPAGWTGTGGRSR
jgi:glucokinase